MQAASFAGFVDDDAALAGLRERFIAVLVPGQIEPDGSVVLDDRTLPPDVVAAFTVVMGSTRYQQRSVLQKEGRTFRIIQRRYGLYRVADESR